MFYELGSKTNLPASPPDPELNLAHTLPVTFPPPKPLLCRRFAVYSVLLTQSQETTRKRNIRCKLRVLTCGLRKNNRSRCGSWFVRTHPPSYGCLTTA